MSFALSKGTIHVTCNSTITNTSISNSNLDMSGEKITNVGTPTLGTDAVNLDYINSIAAPGGLPVTTVTLTGTAETLAVGTLQGSIMLLIKNIITDGPSATFICSKSEQAREASIFRLTSCDGLTTGEKLDIKWEPTEGIYLFKTGLAYDGQYSVKYILI